MSELADLELKSFTLGPFQTNCFVVAAAGRCWLVDVGGAPGPMLDFVDEQGLTVEKIVLTHAHADHIAGLQDAADRYPDAPILIHADEKNFLSDTTLNLSAGFGLPVVAPDATGTLAHGDRLELAGLTFEVRHTPGHSPGGITLHQPDHALALVGDTLFAGSIGRFDFPTSDGPQLIRSIHEQLLTLPDDTAIHPGHGPSSTIGQERASNPYLRETELQR
jgi:glyoxylase-like metal-dependent hydrolase (beta-lactamase superfamily II)